MPSGERIIPTPQLMRPGTEAVGNATQPLPAGSTIILAASHLAAAPPPLTRYHRGSGLVVYIAVQFSRSLERSHRKHCES